MWGCHFVIAPQPDGIREQRLFAGLHLYAQLVFEHFELLEPGGAPLRLTVLEDDDGGDAAYLIFGREVGVAVNVDFDDVGVVAYLIFKLFKHGALHLARAAPCGKEVDKCGLVTVYHVIEFAHNYGILLVVISDLITFPQGEKFFVQLVISN